MTQHFHAVVWIDHHEARILDFNADDVNVDKVTVKHKATRKQSARTGKASWRESEDGTFFDEVAEKLAGAGEILIVGPANAKLGFLNRLQKKHGAIAEHVIGIETVDHPSDGQLLDFARSYFRKADRMLPQVD
ncbi:translational machinery protein [Parvibaculum sp.]|jgi:stalled ribosome rescue protein Dom34|uniref:translational machinery protein n=1 Tax=Parvibaculum sp. TaxID=2024848 RepID=UPI000C56C52B|nr:translational machinery protein [Parvibaculum sp.]MAM95159.1 translational machinery protein [Parvibaculum sp.]HCX66281.1 translational machinery protein [Rhodobiaceae bacterium]|tara:strand:- start:211 stop:609 length:399 start_codon:yes stop_codon:yes gene_type:complete